MKWPGNNYYKCEHGKWLYDILMNLNSLELGINIKATRRQNEMIWQQLSYKWTNEHGKMITRQMHELKFTRGKHTYYNHQTPKCNDMATIIVQMNVEKWLNDKLRINISLWELTLSSCFDFQN